MKKTTIIIICLLAITYTCVLTATKKNLETAIKSIRTSLHRIETKYEKKLKNDPEYKTIKRLVDETKKMLNNKTLNMPQIQCNIRKLTKALHEIKHQKPSTIKRIVKYIIIITIVATLADIVCAYFTLDPVSTNYFTYHFGTLHQKAFSQLIANISLIIHVIDTFGPRACYIVMICNLISTITTILLWPFN